MQKEGRDQEYWNFLESVTNGTRRRFMGTTLIL